MSGGYGGRKSKKQKETEIVKKNNGGPIDKHFLKINRNASDKGFHEVLDESDRLSTQTSLQDVVNEQNIARVGTMVENSNDTRDILNEAFREFDEE
jgi:hypothetical protein